MPSARPVRAWNSSVHAAGFTPRLLQPLQDAELPRYGIGMMNLVSRASATAAELSAAELRQGARELEALVAHWQPRVVAIVGITAYRTAFERPMATLGLQGETIDGTPVWVLPNPSGLSAHHQLPDLIRLFAELRDWLTSRGVAAA